MATTLPCSVMDHLGPGYEGMCEAEELHYQDFTVTLFTTKVFQQHGKIFSSLADACNKMPVDASFQPAPGELVAARSPTEGWARAIVLSSRIEDTYHMAFCDSAISQKLITEIRKLPAEYTEIPRLGVRISIRKFHIAEEEFKTHFLKPGLSFRFMVTENLKGETRALLLSSETRMLLCEVAMSEWSAKWEDRGLRCVGLRSGEKVRVMVHRSTANMYVRSMAERRDLRWQSLIQEVGAHCYSAKPMERMPDKGQLVACKFLLDGCYYRALVTGFRREELCVTYVDFGNSEYVRLEQLKPLSQQLIQVPCQAVLVKLKNVEPLRMTNDAAMFLHNLVIGSTELTVIFDKSYSKEGVELLKENKPISEIINSCLQPNWKLALADGKNPTVPVLFEGKILEMEAPKDCQFRLTILHVENADIFYGCVTDNDISHYVLSRLHKDLAEFCQASPATSYVPRKNELCIVSWKFGNWYRGICMQVNDTVVIVLLIDFGRTVIVNSVDVRKMCEDFIWIDGIALLCSIEGLSENLSDDLAGRLKKLITPFSHHQVKVARVEDGMHFLHMPDIVDTLKKEGFLP